MTVPTLVVFVHKVKKSSAAPLLSLGDDVFEPKKGGEIENVAGCLQVIDTGGIGGRRRIPDPAALLIVRASVVFSNGESRLSNLVVERNPFAAISVHHGAVLVFTNR